MTLKARNTFTLVFSTIFLAFSALTILYYLYKLNLVLNDQAVFNYDISTNNFSIWKDNIWTVFFEAIAMAIYIPTASFYIYARFEKTPSNEVAYFILFLMGCIPEFLRPCIPMETLQNTFPSFLVIAGKALFGGRILAFTSLLASSLLNDTGKNLKTEQHFFLMLIFSLALASAIPVNTTKIPLSFNIQIGWPIFIRLFYALTLILTMISYAINAKNSENPLYFKIGIDILCVMAGFLTMNTSAVFALALPGAVALATGTFRYFTNLHKLYS